MRSVTVPMQAVLDTKEAVEPITIIKIEWDTVGDKYYGDKDVGTLVKGNILAVNSFDVVKQSDNYGSVSSMSLILDDSDQELWGIMNNEEIENKRVTVYQSFEGLSQDDWLILFTGNVVAPINWSEGDQQLSFSVYSNYIKNEEIVGAIVTDFEDAATPALEPNEADYQDKASIGKMLPLVFGNVVCSETLRINTTRKTTTIDAFTAADGAGVYTTSFKINKGYEFPSSTINASVGGVKMRGRVINTTFYVDDYNIPTDLSPTSEVLARVLGDVDELNYNVAWIDTPENLVNKWVWFNNAAVGHVINYCESREGTKHFFRDSFVRQVPDYTEDPEIGPFLFFPDENLSILQSAKYLNKSWPYSVAIEQDQILPLWSVLPGSEFVVLDVPDVYCTNYEPMTNIKGVFAFRNVHHVVKFSDGTVVDNGKTRQLVPVPSSYYSKRSAYGFNGRYISALEFDIPLSLRTDEEWEDNVWVVQASPISNNTSVVLEYLIENFTSLTVDSTSFNAVASKLTDYPSDFGVYTTKKPLDLVRQIAWLARCAVVIENDVAYLKYLSEEPASVKTITKADILFKSLKVEFTDTESTYTRISGTFPTNEAIGFLEDQNHYGNLRGLFYKGEIAKYGLKQTTWDFFIYNLRDYAAKSLTFWGDRYSKSWKKIRLTCFWGQLDLQLFDCVTLSFPDSYPIGIDECKAIVDEWRYNSADGTIELVLLIPLLAGTQTVSPLFWLDDSGDGITYFDSTVYYNEVDYDIIIYVNKSNTSSTQEYGVVSAASEEIINGVPTGVTEYEIELHDNGFENGGSE